MELERAFEVLERARKQQSCDLADGLIDNVMPYWEIIEEALGNILSDEECSEALEAVTGDRTARNALEGTHNGFFQALLGRYDRIPKTKGRPAVPRPGTLASEHPDVADFIEHGLYEAFSVPDMFGTFDIVVMPGACEVGNEYLPIDEDNGVSGYVIDSDKMLVVTREGGKVTDVRHADATTRNIHLVMTQGDKSQFDWDAVESPAHDRLRRDGAIPEQGQDTRPDTMEGRKTVIESIHDGTLAMDVLTGQTMEGTTEGGTETARYSAFLRSSTGQAVLDIRGDSPE